MKLLQRIKGRIQKNRMIHADSEYQKQLELARQPYKQWILESEGKHADVFLTEDGVHSTVEDNLIRIENFTTNNQILLKNRFTVFCARDGILAKTYMTQLEHAFLNEQTMLVYGDEDSISDGGRIAPFFKPDFSPDTLMSFLYIGNVVAVRTELLQKITAEMSFTEKGIVNYYDMLLRVTEKITRNQIIHLNTILFHKFLDKNASEPVVLKYDTKISGTDADFDTIKTEAGKRRQQQISFMEDRFGNHQVCYQVSSTEDAPLISVVIPSRDQPELLRNCIQSLYTQNPDVSFEIIVIDNGSMGANRVAMANLRETLSFRYFYEPGDFDFSRMSNSGARKAKGEYVLFLNDDTRWITHNGLALLAGQCSLSHVGSVGAKLLYEDELTIQHVGVVNVSTGPSHKLIGQSDDFSYYYGRNVLTYDVTAVTAACLMIRKKLFDEIQGFDTDFEVSYNDVDLCFRLLENGYYNVIRNDVSLIHYESASRGKDTIQPENWNRLLTERSFLFHKHPNMLSKDEFYSCNLTQSMSDFECRDLQKEQDIPVLPEKIKENRKVIVPDTEDLNIYIDLAGYNTQKDLMNSQKEYLIEGWYYVRGRDNALYQPTLLLEDRQGTIYKCKVQRFFREDVIQTFQMEQHIELSGFRTIFAADALPEETYTIGIQITDVPLKAQVKHMTNQQLTIKRNEK